MTSTIERRLSACSATCAVLGSLIWFAGCSTTASNRPDPKSVFATITPGMTQGDVLARLGPPTWTSRVRQEDLTILNYRFSHSECLIYQVSVRPDGSVRDTGTGLDAACDGRMDRTL